MYLQDVKHPFNEKRSAFSVHNSNDCMFSVKAGSIQLNKKKLFLLVANVNISAAKVFSMPKDLILRFIWFRACRNHQEVKLVGPMNAPNFISSEATSSVSSRPYLVFTCHFEH